MEFHSAIKKNEILSFAGKWRELENMFLSEVSQDQKAQCCLFSPISGTQNQFKYKQYYEHRSHYGTVTNRRGRVKEGS
jgi:hypothetical protein